MRDSTTTYLSNRLRLILIHSTHKPHPQRLVRPKNPRTQRHILDPAQIAHAMRQPTQRADIRRNPNIHLLNTDLRILRRDPDITRKTHIQRETKTDSVQHGDDGLLAALQVRDAILELEDVAPEVVGFAGYVDGGVGGLGQGSLRCGLDVEAGGEGARARAGEEDGADGGVVGEGTEDGGEVLPHSGGDGC